MAREHNGRSTGDRAIIVYRVGDSAVFAHTFPKNRKANLTAREEDAFREAAKEIARLDAKMVEALIGSGEWSRSIMDDTKKVYRSDPLRSVHLAMKGLHEAGAIDKLTMRRFDLACLTPVEAFSPDAIKAMRETANMSQAIFAMTLNVTTSLVSKWERGEKKPSGPSLKLLSLAMHKGIGAII